MSTEARTTTRRAATWVLFTAFALVIAVLVGIPGRASRKGVADAGISDLVRTTANRRLSLPRLTGGFGYAPLTRTASPSDPSSGLMEVAGRLQQQFEQSRTPAAAHAFGIAGILVGSPEIAVTALERALLSSPDDPGLWSDLSAAYIVRALQGGRAEDWPKAVEAAARAQEISPLPEAAYNFAIALEHLNLRRAAVRAWSEFLRLDGKSGWAAEARANLQRLDARVEDSPTEAEAAVDLERLVANGDSGAIRERLRQHPDVYRRAAEGRQLEQFVQSRMAGRPGPGMADLAHVIESEFNDAFLGELIAAAGSAEGLRQLGIIINVRNLLNTQQRLKGCGLLDAGAVPDARWTALRAWHDYLVTHCALFGRQVPTALSHAESLVKRLRGLRYPILLGRVHFVQGLAFVQQGRFTDAITAQKRATALYASASESSLRASALAEIALAEDYLSDSAEAWVSRLEGLNLVLAGNVVRSRHIALIGAARAAALAQWPRAALEFDREAAANATVWNEVGAMAETLLQESRDLLAIGRLDDAERSLQRARLMLAAVSDPAVASGWRTETLSLEAELAARRESPAGPAIFDQAIAASRAVAYAPVLPRLYLDGARAALGLGDREDAERRLRAGIEALEAQFFQQALDRRAGALDRAWDLYVELADLQQMRGDNSGAMQTLDRGRRRLNGFPEATAPAAVPLPLPGHGIVSFLVTNRRVCTWLITSSGITAGEVTIERERLSRLIALFESSTRDRDDDSYGIYARELHRILFESLPVAVPARLTIVPDELTSRIPFAAMIQPNGAFLGAERVLSLSESLNDAFTTYAADDAPALFVGNPAALSQNLPPLPGALREVERSARSYRQSRMLTSRDATKPAFLSLLPEHGIVHFAGHAIAVPENPSRSRLLFAGEGDDGALTAREIDRLDLRHVQLVVLAGCESASGHVYRAGGVGSVAAPFLRAGARTVIASLWLLDDAAAEELMAVFHADYSVARDAPSALAKAQQHLRSAQWRHPYYWASSIAYSASQPPGQRGES